MKAAFPQLAPLEFEVMTIAVAVMAATPLRSVRGFKNLKEVAQEMITIIRSRLIIYKKD